MKIIAKTYYRHSSPPTSIRFWFDGFSINWLHVAFGLNCWLQTCVCLLAILNDRFAEIVEEELISFNYRNKGDEKSQNNCADHRPSSLFSYPSSLFNQSIGKDDAAT